MDFEHFWTQSTKFFRPTEAGRLASFSDVPYKGGGARNTIDVGGGGGLWDIGC